MCESRNQPDPPTVRPGRDSRFILVPALREELAVRIPAGRPGQADPGMPWQPGPPLDPAQPQPVGAPIRIGYARCSTAQQDLQIQLDALRAAKCNKVFSEKISSRIKVRPEFDKALSLARDIKTGRARPAGHPDRARTQTPGPQRRRAHGSGRLPRRRRHPARAAHRPAGGHLRPHGMGALLFAVLAVAAQLDRNYIREKTLEGQKAAAAKGFGEDEHVVVDDFGATAVVALYGTREPRCRPSCRS
jgi:hypothetical protein